MTRGRTGAATAAPALARVGRRSDAPTARSVRRATRSADTPAPAVRHPAPALSWHALAGMALALALALVAVVSLALMPRSDRAAWQTARSGAADCVVSLSGPTESDAADVAACVDSAIVRASAP